jgi:hypothetical protein
MVDSPYWIAALDDLRHLFCQYLHQTVSVELHEFGWIPVDQVKCKNNSDQEANPFQTFEENLLDYHHERYLDEMECRQPEKRQSPLTNTDIPLKC